VCGEKESDDELASCGAVAVICAVGSRVRPLPQRAASTQNTTLRADRNKTKSAHNGSTRKKIHERRRGVPGCCVAPLVMMALVAAGTLNSSAAYLSTAVNGASSGTFNLRTRNGWENGNDVQDVVSSQKK
jgi:hypothetical protein